jgi:small subunit ribosomal protein S8
MMTDPIADMLTRIRNASLARKKEVLIPFSKIKMEIAQILVKHGYLVKAEKTEDKHANILAQLKNSHNGESAIQNIKRVSTPGHRCYVKNGEIKEVLNGFGLSILSTPKGLMTGDEAKVRKVGGELICEVY